MKNEAPSDEQTLDRLAKLTPIEYDRVRESEAKRLEIRAATLDKQVQIARSAEQLDSDSGHDELLGGVVPWPEPVQGLQVAEEARDLFRRFCILPAGGEVALTLWCLSTYSIDSFRIFPKCCLSSPEKRCGKTTTLEVIGALVDRGMVAANLTPAVLFRAIDAWRPSLLIDEGDTFLHGNEELRGIINSGHNKRSAFVLRVEGDSGDRQPVKFSTWAPMCIAMIKTPPDTIKDRSVLITLRRKMAGESVERLPLDLADDVRELRQKIKRWADDNSFSFRMSDPDVPNVTNDRAMDNWRPLITLADKLGGSWPEEARAAMLTIEARDGDEEDGIGPMILADIQEIFYKKRQDRIMSNDLVDALVEMEDRPWPEYKGGRPITAPTLARMLKPFGVKSTDIRFGPIVKKGYRLDSFTDCFARYLSTPQQAATPATPQQARQNAGCSVADKSNVAGRNATPQQSELDKCCGVADGLSSENGSATPNPRQNAGCSVVAGVAASASGDGRANGTVIL